MGEELEGEQAEQPTKIITDDPGVVAGTDVEQTQTSGVRPEYVHKRRSFRPGEVVAEHFQIVRLLGEGGMGEVFVARDTALGRRVAIKTLKLPQFASEAARARFVQLFERDAASTAQLSHSGIVTIFQFGEHQGTSFFVLELVDGQPLDDILARGGALEQREVLRLGVQLCQALSYAHSKGVIHRDIKPANLMRTRDGRLKVLDFGVALLKKAREDLEEAFGTSHAVLEQRLSEEIITAGTPPYMAPEQLQGLEQDERTDIWGVGITLFELLTGRRPRPSSPSDTEAFELVWPDGCEVSESVRAAVQGCLTYSFDARTASMHLLGAQLKAALEELIAPGVEWRGEHRKTNLVALPDAFVGRQGDLAALDALVFGGAQGGGRRLVTLVGPGGVGKTRLVTEWGLGAVEREGVHQVAFCSLTEAQTEDDVLFGLGGALGVPLTQKDPVAQLGHVFERKQGLVLILDNCEQVARQVAGLLSGWAASLAQVKVVATSRVGLEVRGEHLLPLEPLGDEQEAMALYTERARQQRPGWVCPQDQQGALRELVDQLDRLPLAI
ncbi:MAG: protein kinase, partial [Myxococcota bacterium]